ncbi:MAG TPA: DHA2 family efflux MFS transporter permease subunit [Solirubrobacteraceae bacterium]|jgi:EmrB/QacA subfamily drug resistance transporter|nr:DHA2 family efflux MFS transporter permease subunit [Solirubrobacteraceae bacterium]
MSSAQDTTLTGRGPELTDRIERHVWVIAGVVILGMVMSILDTTIVNVALDTLSKDLHSPISQVQWVVTGYLLALAAVIPVTGWAARRFGAKQVYLVSLVLFTAGSAACGFANSLGALVLFRVLQGVGGGMIMPVGQMIMAQMAGPQRMGKVMGVIAMPAMLAPILGPVLGGIILQNLHWSWIFFVNVPVGLVAFTLGWRMIPKTESGEAGRLDVLGLALLSGGSVGVVYGLSELGSGATIGSASVLLPAIAGLGLVLLFGLHAPRVPRPLLDLKLYRSRAFSAASITTFGLGAALFGAMILVPLYYQQVRGESVIVTGLLNGPQGLGALISMPLASRLTERFGAGRVAITGVSLLALMTLPLAFVGSDTSILLISLTLFVRGFSIGLSFMPAMTVAYQSLRRDQISDATPQMNVLQRVGGAIGTAILAVVLQRASVGAVATGNAIKHAASPEQAAALHATLSQQLASAFDTSYWWAFGIAVLSLVPCVFLLRVERPPQAERAEEPPLEAAPMEAVGA